MMFTRSKEDPKKSAPSPVPVRKDAGAPSIISTGVEITGNINSPGEIQLDGTIDGDISCGAFSLGESGKVNGRITAESVTIRGRVDGEICGAKVRLEKTAQVFGDVTHQTLSVEGGARVSGHLIHNEKPLEKVNAAPGKPVAATGSTTERSAQPQQAAEQTRAPASQNDSGKPNEPQRRESVRQQEQPQGGRAKASA